MTTWATRGSAALVVLRPAGRGTSAYPVHSSPARAGSKLSRHRLQLGSITSHRTPSEIYVLSLCLREEDRRTPQLVVGSVGFTGSAILVLMVRESADCQSRSVASFDYKLD